MAHTAALIDKSILECVASSIITLTSLANGTTDGCHNKKEVKIGTSKRIIEVHCSGDLGSERNVPVVDAHMRDGAILRVNVSTCPSGAGISPYSEDHATVDHALDR